MGYSIFQLIEKREIEDSVLISSGNSGSSKLNYLLKEINKQTANLASKYNVSIDHSMVNSLSPLNLNVITIEKLGFGNKLSAFPFTPQDYEWYDDDYLIIQTRVP